MENTETSKSIGDVYIGKTEQIEQSKVAEQIYEPGKLFLGGLDRRTNEAEIDQFYSRFGEISDTVVMRNVECESKGFGFITFVDPNSALTALDALPHIIHGKSVDAKKAVPKGTMNASRWQTQNSEPFSRFEPGRLYVAGVTGAHTEDGLMEYFEQFGPVASVTIKNTKQCAFIEFKDDADVEKVVENPSHFIGNYRCDVKRAYSRQEMERSNQQQQNIRNQYMGQMRGGQFQRGNNKFHRGGGGGKWPRSNYYNDANEVQGAMWSQPPQQQQYVGYVGSYMQPYLQQQNSAQPIYATPTASNDWSGPHYNAAMQSSHLLPNYRPYQ